MDPFSFAPIAALLASAYAFVETLASLLTPIAGTSAAALAVVVLTLLVRAALVPVGASQVRAEWTRRRLAPTIRALQEKYKKNPQRMQEKMMALYRAENTSPFAGMLPTLAQAPVVSIIYALFIHTQIAGQANALLTETLLGVPLGTSFVHAVSVGAWPMLPVFAALFAVIAVVAWLSRRIALRLTPAGTPITGLTTTLSWLPFITLIFAAFVPLAATLYLTTTTVWTIVERALLRRRYWRGEEGTAAVPARA